jgi:hypothetical protein
LLVFFAQRSNGLVEETPPNVLKISWHQEEINLCRDFFSHSLDGYQVMILEGYGNSANLGEIILFDIKPVFNKTWRQEIGDTE